MDQTGIYRASLSLEGPKEARYYLVEDSGDQFVELGVIALGFYLQVQRKPQILGEERLPAALPLRRLWKVTTKSGHVEAKLAIR